MKDFANPLWLQALAWIISFLIVVLNGWLLYQTVSGWLK
jgi:Mn2+/Fe2+ NRAMP family transporter